MTKYEQKHHDTGGRHRQVDDRRQAENQPQRWRQLTTKYITEDGTYKASDDGYYGYSQVTVSGIGKVTGMGSDGNEHSISKDGSGNLIDTTIPSRLSVVTPPTVTEYADGATIDFSGIVVKAYLEDGTLWTDTNHPDGVIPIGELSFPVTVADASGVDEHTASSTLETQPASPIKFANGACYKTHGGSGEEANTYTHTFTGACIVFVVKTNYGWVHYIFANSTGSPVTEHIVGILDATGVVFEDRTVEYQTYNQFTYDGKTAFYLPYNSGDINREFIYPSPEHLPYGTEITDGSVAWTILYGTISGGVQNIPVQWARPWDGETLEDSFGITVNAATGGGGQAGENGTGRND